MHIDSESSFKPYLIHELEDICDADPGALADYIIALLKHDKSMEELESLCIEQLDDFLKNETKPFVKHLFKSLESKEWLKRRHDGPEYKSKAPKLESPYKPSQREYDNRKSNTYSRSERSHDYDRRDHPDRRDRRDDDYREERTKKRGICYQYERRGTCSNGAACIYEHIDNVPAYGQDDRRHSNNNSRQDYRYRPQTKPDRKNILLLECIPAEKCSVDAINTYFKRFGTLINIQVDSKNFRASLEFTTNDEATAAITNPEAIFDNRFVKLVWPRLNIDEEVTPQLATPKYEPIVLPTVFKYERVPAAEQREEAKKEKSRLLADLKKKQDDLIEKQIQDQKAIMLKLENTKMDSREKMALLDTLKVLANSTQSVIEKITSPTEETASPTLVAKLQMLEQEAVELGIPVSVPPTNTFRGRGNGRGFIRGSRGRGGVFRGGAHVRPMVLDNRTKTIVISNVDSSFDNELKAHFESIGSLQSFSALQDSEYSAHFQNRYSAEKAMNTSITIPGLSGIRLSWYRENAQEE